MLLDWLSGKAALSYPVPPAPRTAVLVSWVRPSAQVRVFAEGWRPETEAFQPAALAGDWGQFEALLGCRIPWLTHAIVVLARTPEDLLSESQRRDLWRAFRVPVFEQILAANGSVLAAECEAHDGLHVESRELAAELGSGEGIAVAIEPCGCGRTTPRLKRVSDREQILCELAEK